MDKVEELIDELHQLCKEEGVNLIATATKTGVDQVVKSVMSGKLPELIMLVLSIQNDISEKVEMPYALIEMDVMKNYGEND